MFFFIDKPTAPTSLVVSDVKEESVGLSWKPPSNENEAGDSLKFVVEQKKGDGTSYFLLPTILNLKATVLTLVKGRLHDQVRFRLLYCVFYFMARVSR